MFRSARSLRAARASSIRTRRPLAPTLIRRVLLYIEANLENRIRNSDLAAVACLSVFYFNGVFRTTVGHSPHDYVIRRRVERAKHLMLSTDKTLAEIAAECGLTDQPHFTRLFRRFVGESPAAWRRCRQREATDEPKPSTQPSPMPSAGFPPRPVLTFRSIEPPMSESIDFQ